SAVDDRHRECTGSGSARDRARVPPRTPLVPRRRAVLARRDAHPHPGARERGRVRPRARRPAVAEDVLDAVGLDRPDRDGRVRGHVTACRRDEEVRVAAEGLRIPNLHRRGTRASRRAQQRTTTVAGRPRPVGRGDEGRPPMNASDMLAGWDIARADNVEWIPWGGGNARAKVLCAADGHTMVLIEAGAGYEGSAHT